MKVVFVTESFDTVRDASGGVRVSVRRQADVLSRRHDVVVIAPHKVFLPLGRYSSTRRRQGAWPGLRTREGAVRVYRPLLLHVPVLGGALEPVGLALFVVAACALFERGASLIHAHRCFPSGFAALLAGRLLRLPVLVTVYGSDVNAGLDRRVVGRWVSFATARCLRDADAVLAVSRALEDRVRAAGARTGGTSVVPSGVDLSELGGVRRKDARARLGITAARVVLYAANLVPVKDPLTMLRAFGLLRRRRGDAVLAVLGVGELERRASEESRSLGLSDSVMFLGRRPREEVPLWLAASDVVALSSLDEGCPVIALEAFASGRPFVGTTVGGLPEIVPPDAGLLVQPGDPAALAGALEAALDRSWDEDVIRAHGLAFSWESVVSRVEAVYEGLARGRAA